MAYDLQLAERVRKRLGKYKALTIQEKKMFGGLAFLVNGKMCINIGDCQLMCRYHPALHQQLTQRKGVEPTIMNGKEYTGYCYVDKAIIEKDKDLFYWIQLCLDYNSEAKSSRK